jgi:hypothetical protein
VYGLTYDDDDDKALLLLLVLLLKLFEPLSNSPRKFSWSYEDIFRFEAFTAVAKNSSSFWDITPDYRASYSRRQNSSKEVTLHIFSYL